MGLTGHTGGGSDRLWRVGLAGAGAFGQFVLTALAPRADVMLTAVAARSRERREAAICTWQASRKRHGLPADPVAEWDDAAALAAGAPVDVVLVAVPPDLQPAVARAAIAAGRAVLVEKPGALAPEELAEVDRLARSRGVPAAINLVMRANPLLARVRDWYRAGRLGAPERWHVENWAGGELPPWHWFWERRRSGGVLVEHGVHFFDEVAWVLDARPAAAWSREWPHPRLPGVAARALAVVEYRPAGPAAAGQDPAADGSWHLVASFYHGFVRPAGDEHQVRELGFSRGWIRLYGWVPERLEAELDLPPEARAALAQDPLVQTAPAPGGRTRVTAALGDRDEAYRAMIRAGFDALLAAACGEGQPLAPLAAGVEALAVATAAGRASRGEPAESMLWSSAHGLET